MRLIPLFALAAFAVASSSASAAARQAGPELELRSVEVQWAKSKGGCKYKYKSDRKGWKEEYKCK